MPSVTSSITHRFAVASRVILAIRWLLATHRLVCVTFIVSRRFSFISARRFWFLPFIRLVRNLVQETPIENPCIPSPCGLNSQCRAVDDHAVCSCVPDMIGAPPNCRPECILSSECGQEKSCINQKCKDPCPGVCGQHARCLVVNHNPICSCSVGYNGDPFVRCIKEEPRKSRESFARLCRGIDRFIAFITFPINGKNFSFFTFSMRKRNSINCRELCINRIYRFHGMKSPILVLKLVPQWKTPSFLQSE